MAQSFYPTDKQANSRFVQAAMKAPMLERDNELTLAKRWQQGDENALHTLIESYTRLVVAMAVKFRHYGLPMDDLIQEGNIGLMEAAKRFKPELGNRFSTYAAWWIRAQMQDYVLRNWSIVRTGTTSRQKTLFFNLRRLRAKISQETGQNHLDDENIRDIAKELKVTPEDVNTMDIRLRGGDWSLNAKIGEDSEDEWQDLLADTTPNPETVLIHKGITTARKQWLHDAIDSLTPRERTIIKARCLSEKNITLDALGKRLGISKERVRQLERRSLDKMKISILASAQKNGFDQSNLLN